MKILMVLTSYDKLGNTGDKTGFGLKSLPHRIMFLKTPVPSLPSHHHLEVGL